jgi:hypothetical protein
VNLKTGNIWQVRKSLHISEKWMPVKVAVNAENVPEWVQHVKEMSFKHMRMGDRVGVGAEWETVQEASDVM